MGNNEAEAKENRAAALVARLAAAVRKFDDGTLGEDVLMAALYGTAMALLDRTEEETARLWQKTGGIAAEAAAELPAADNPGGVRGKIARATALSFASLLLDTGRRTGFEPRHYLGALADTCTAVLTGAVPGGREAVAARIEFAGIVGKICRRALLHDWRQTAQSLEAVRGQAREDARRGVFNAGRYGDNFSARAAYEQVWMDNSGAASA